MRRTSWWSPSAPTTTSTRRLGWPSSATSSIRSRGAQRLGELLPSFREGRAVVGVCDAPFKCPPAPSEAALLLHDYLTERGLRDACEIEFLIPFARPVPPSPETRRR